MGNYLVVFLRTKLILQVKGHLLGVVPSLHPKDQVYSRGMSFKEPIKKAHHDFILNSIIRGNNKFRIYTMGHTS